MLIVCPACASEYRIPDHHIGDKGRTLRCASCRETWFVAPETFEDDHALAVEAVSRHLQDDALIWQKPEPVKPSFLARLVSAAKAVPLLVLAPLRLLSPAYALGLTLFAVLAGSYIGRHTIVSSLPQLGGLYALVGLPVNVAGLDFRNIRSEIVLNGPEAILVVEGEIANLSSHEKDIPTIAINLKGASHQVLYQWSVEPPRRHMAGQETARFRARLASPPAEAQQVLVKFDDKPSLSGKLAAH